MLSFLKVFARGIITTILLPLILTVWVLYGAYCLVLFFVMLVKSLMLFFAGDSAVSEMKEDIEAKRMLLEQEQMQVDTNQMLNVMFQNTLNQMQQQQYQQPNQPQSTQFQQPQQSFVQPSQPQQSFEQSQQPTYPNVNTDVANNPNNNGGNNDNGQSY